jgi:hypothetical protein
MINFNPEFQSVIALALGIFLGVFSYGFFMTVLYIVAFEFFVFSKDFLDNNKNDSLVVDRITINLLFIFGWIFSKYLLIRETGLEDFKDNLIISANGFIEF